MQYNYFIFKLLVFSTYRTVLVSYWNKTLAPHNEQLLSIIFIGMFYPNVWWLKIIILFTIIAVSKKRIVLTGAVKYLNWRYKKITQKKKLEYLIPRRFSLVMRKKFKVIKFEVKISYKIKTMSMGFSKEIYKDKDV